MNSFGSENEFAQKLIDAGSALLKPPSSTDDLLSLLAEIESLLFNVEQDPPLSIQDALRPSMKALISVDLFTHPDSDVRVSVVSCLTEITRITAPEVPYNDDQMKQIFHLMVQAFGKLADLSCRSYKKAESIFDTFSNIKLCLVMLDLDCNELILKMFQDLLKIISPDHPQVVLRAIETVMITTIDESDEISMALLDILLACVRKDNEKISPTSSRLVEKVLSRCACKLKPYIMAALKFPGYSLELYSSVISSICQTESDATKGHLIVNAKKNEVDEKISPRPAVPSDSLEENLDLGLSRKRIPSGKISSHLDDSSKRAVRDRSTPTNEVDNRSGSISVQTTQSVAISLRSPYRIRRGASTRSRGRTEEKDQDTSDLPSLKGKKETSSVKAKKKRSPSPHASMENELSDEEYLMTSNHEGFQKVEDGRKAANSSRKAVLQNCVEKTAMKMPLTGAKKVEKTSGKEISIQSDAKVKGKESSTFDGVIHRSSNSKKMDTKVATSPSTKGSDETTKSHPKRNRSARIKVGTETPEIGEELIGKKIKVWWPLDKMFYEGVINSYDNEKKKHMVLYSDGEHEMLNLKRHRWEFIEDKGDQEIDLPESTTLSGILQMQKAHKHDNSSSS